MLGQGAIGQFAIGQIGTGTDNTTTDKWFSPLSSPVFGKPDRDALRDRATFVAKAVHIGWFGALSTPVLKKAISVALIASSGPIGPPPQLPPTNIAWLVGLSEPVRAKANIGPARQQFIAVPAVTETVLADKWYQRFTDPVRQKAGLLAAQQSVSNLPPFPVTASFNWFNSFVDPTRARLFVKPDSLVAPATPETITVDKWFSPLRDPTRRTAQKQTDQHPVSLFPPTPSFGWYSALSDPTRLRATFPRHEQAITDTDPVVPFGWFGALQDPTRPKKSVTQSDQFVAPFQSVPSFGWYSALSVPTQKAAFRRHETSVVAPTQPQVTPQFGWYNPFSEPTRRKPFLLSQQGDINPVQPEAISPFGWLSGTTLPFSEFTVLYQTTALAPFQPPAPVVTSFAWQNALSEPVRGRPDRDALRDRITFVAKAVHIGWFSGLSEPVRVKPGLIAAAQQFLALNSTTPPPETIFADKWFQRFSEPVRVKPSLGAAQPYFSYQPLPLITSFSWFGELRDPIRRVLTPTRYEQTVTDTDPVVSFGWFGGLSDPTRAVRNATRYEQPSWSLSSELITPDKWFVSLSEPVRRKLVAIPAEQYAGYQPIVPFGWFEDLSIPVKLPVGLKVAQQPYFNFNPLPITPTFGWFTDLSTPTRRILVTRSEQPPWTLFSEIITPDKWFSLLSEPVRRVLLRPSDQVEPPLVTVPFSWFKDLTEPVRIKRRPIWLDEQSFQFPFVPFSYFRGFAEPTPPKRRTIDFPAFTFPPLPVQLSFGWYDDLTLPRWNKPKVWEGQYQAWDPATLSFVHVCGMDAKEQRDFLIAVLSTFNLPVNCYVDIIENDPRIRGYMGIIENAAENNILTSIVEPETIPATGSAVSTVASARVAIITG